MKFLDRVTIDGTKRRGDGSLVVDARVARTGIQHYAGYEVGRPDLAIVRVWRPESEVFAGDAMASFGHRPVTNDHPAQMVTSENWKDVAVGNTSGDIARDGSFIRVPLMVSDAAAITDVENGKRELSAGYTCDLAFEAGTNDDGEAYDAVQRNIRANHVAIVSRGRAGSEVRIGDASKWGPAPITPTMDKESRSMNDTLRTVMVDGLSVKTTDEGATAITKLLGDLTSSAAKLSDAQSSHKLALDAKDAELAKKDAEIATLKGQLVTGDALDKLVQDRAALIDRAKKVAPKLDPKGMSDADIRKAAVVAVRGEDAAKDKSEAYIHAAFDLLADAPDNTARDVLRSAVQPGQVNDNGQSAYEARISAGWKGKKEA